MLLEAPISLPIATALLCPPTQALACSFSYYVGLASSNQHFSIATEYSLGEDTTIHLSSLLFMAIWVLDTLWLWHIVLPRAVHRTSFGKTYGVTRCLAFNNC